MVQPDQTSAGTAGSSTRASTQSSLPVPPLTAGSHTAALLLLIPEAGSPVPMQGLVRERPAARLSQDLVERDRSDRESAAKLSTPEQPTADHPDHAAVLARTAVLRPAVSSSRPCCPPASVTIQKNSLSERSINTTVELSDLLLPCGWSGWTDSRLLTIIHEK